MADQQIWKEVKDPKTGRTYYYNRKTRETTWKRPASYRTESKMPARTRKSKSVIEKSRDANLPENWRSKVDAKSGRVYYYNKKTKETSWRRPNPDGTIDEKKSSDNMPRSKVRSASLKTSSMQAVFTSDEPLFAVDGETYEETGNPDKNTNNDNNNSINNGNNNNSSRRRSKSKEKRQKTGNVSADGNWEEIIDPKTHRKYWCHKTTKETAWELPSSSRTLNQQESAPKIAKNDSFATSSTNNLNPQSPINVDMSLALDTNLNNQSKMSLIPNNNSTKLSPTKSDEMLKPSANMFMLKQTLHSKSINDLARQEQQNSRQQLMSNVGMSKLTVAEDEYMEDDITELNYKFAKHRKTAVGRLLKIGPAASNSELLQWQSEMIKLSLLKKNRSQDILCITCFKYIMAYMGDRKSIKPNRLEHAYRLIEIALQNTSGIRDEIYLQLVKQLSNNPNPDSVILGWELMALCIACFPPSRELKNYMKSFIQNVIENNPGVALNRLAKANLQNLMVVSRIGQRKEIPSEMEMDSIRYDRPLQIDIFYVDGSKDTVEVDSFTTVETVENQLASKLDLDLRTIFGMYQFNKENPKEELYLEKSVRICDILAQWRPFQGSKRGSITNIKISKYNTFLFKARLVLKTTENAILSDPTAVNLLHLQAVHDVLKQKYPIKESDHIVLAALQLQATKGDYEKGVSDLHLRENLDKYISKQIYLNEFDNEDIIKKDELIDQIVNNYSKIAGFSNFEAKLNYLDYVQDWKFYGYTPFTIEQRQFKEHPDFLECGITCEGVLLIHPQKQTILEFYPYNDVVTWGHTEDRLIIVVGNLVQQRKLIFKTEEGIIVSNLIKGYIDFKVQQSENVEVEQSQNVNM